MNASDNTTLSVAKQPPLIPEADFRGPLFVIGIYRSGTKLLRDLLNQHSQIGMPPIETHFIPHFVKKYGQPPDLRSEPTWRAFLKEFRATSFYWNAVREGFELDEKSLLAADRQSWPSLMKPLLLQFVPAGKNEVSIWGDKTPPYMMHIPLLKRAFPEAKFLHIIRDPRDCCVSVHRTWGRSQYRTADRWRHSVNYARACAAAIPGDYLEVQFEQLLEHPEAVMRAVSAFLGVVYDPKMITLDRPSENLGDAKGKTKIVSGNKHKFHEALTPKQVRRIEEITYPVMTAVGYHPEYATIHKPLNRLHRWMLVGHDWFKSMRFYFREKGLWGGASYMIRLKKMRTWRGT